MSWKRVLLIIGAAAVLIVGGGGLWKLLDSRPPLFDQESRLKTVRQQGLTVQREAYGWQVSPGDGDGGAAPAAEGRGVILYPGAKVEPLAYLNLAAGLARQGYTAALVRMPFHLAVLDWNRGNRVVEAHPEVKAWTAVGHSLGGAMAFRWVLREEPPVDSLVLLGAYPDGEDLRKAVERGWSAEGEGSRKFVVRGLVLAAEMDRIADPGEIAEKVKPLTRPPQGPEKSRWGMRILPGGNHAGFGMYGPQKGDGEAEIPPLQQQTMTVDWIEQWLRRGM